MLIYHTKLLAEPKLPNHSNIRPYSYQTTFGFTQPKTRFTIDVKRKKRNNIFTKVTTFLHSREDREELSNQKHASRCQDPS